MSLTVSPAVTPAGEPEWGRTAFLARAALATAAAVYAFARFGWSSGLLAFAAACVVVLMDAVQAFGLRRALFAGVLRFALIAAQAAVICGVFFLPAPLGWGSSTPPPVMLESPLFLLLLCFLASHVSAARPWLVWQTGVAILAAWVGVLAWTRSRPDIATRASLHPERMKSVAALLAAVNSPHYFNFDLWKSDLQICAATAFVLGLAAYRMRWLARRAAGREAERDALAGYFSPQVVETILASRRDGLSPRERQVAVLDSDLVGFTGLAETLSPERTAQVLGLYRSLVEAEVFGEDGAILNWTGDGAVAVFGLTGDGGTAAARALACARRLEAAWSAEARRMLGDAAPQLAVGLDFGEAFLGLVGKGGAVSLLMIGAPVQGAARLQAITREVDAPVLISVAAKASIDLADPAAGASLSRLVVAGHDAWTPRAVPPSS